LCDATSTVRKNILHNGGGTNAINFYTDGNPVYSDVLIENNLVYNPTATVCIDVEQISTNVIIRNNTFIGHKRNEDFDEYMYNVAFYVGSYASGYNGSGLNLYNNIFVGIATIVPGAAYVNNDYNIAYSGNDFATAHSVIALNIPSSSYFESGFFNGALNLKYGSIPDQVLDLTLKTGSSGINFGDPANQPSDSLGSLDGNGFIQINGAARDASHHSAGCYEYIASGSPTITPSISPTPTISPTQTISMTFTTSPTISPTPSFSPAITYTATIQSVLTPGANGPIAGKPYPNPFNPSQGQKMIFPSADKNSILLLYNVSGELIREIRISSIGQIEWDGKNTRGLIVTKGVYIYIIKDMQGYKKQGKIAVNH
jgi:hypothetical protein